MGEKWGTGVIKGPFQEDREARNSNLCSMLGMYNGMTERRMGVLGTVGRGAVKRWSRGQFMQRLVEHLTQLRFHPWGNENLSILAG